MDWRDCLRACVEHQRRISHFRWAAHEQLCPNNHNEWWKRTLAYRLDALGPTDIAYTQHSDRLPGGSERKP